MKEGECKCKGGSSKKWDTKGPTAKGENKNQINGNLIHSTCHSKAPTIAVFVLKLLLKQHKFAARVVWLSYLNMAAQQRNIPHTWDVADLPKGFYTEIHQN